jgi:transposase InsO family protein
VRRGGAVRILNVVDDYTRLSFGSVVARSIGARAVVDHLQRLTEIWGQPSAIRSDNGREFIAATVVGWLAERNVEPVFIEKASPQQNPYVERFNGTMRRNLLNVEEFDTVTEAQVLLNRWKTLAAQRNGPKPSECGAATTLNVDRIVGARHTGLVAHLQLNRIPPQSP